MPNRTNTPSRPSVRRLSLGLALGAFLTLAGCTSLSSAPPPEQVRQRATERWQALIAGDFKKAYTYNTPGFRAAVTPDGFRGRFGNTGTWLAGDVLDVNCPEEAKCIAKLRIDFKYTLSNRYGDKLTSVVEEIWLLEAGQWWVFQAL